MLRAGYLLLPWLLLVAAAVTFALQPDTTPIDPDVIIGLAGLAGVALSLGFAVALLVAQHTAERHARLMFAEFRSDRTWALTLGSFAIGVALIVTAGIARPTFATAWASVIGLLWLGLLGAQAFPRLLDSLDPVVLTERVANRSVRRILASKRSGILDSTASLDALAERGVTACATVAQEALVNDDAEVFEAAIRGLASTLIAYLRQSPWAAPTDAPIDRAFQRIDVISDAVSQRSQVILMPVLIAELRKLGLEAPRIAAGNPNENDAISTRLTMVFFELLAASPQNRTSVAPAFAATTIADLGVALLAAGQPNGVRDHIDKLSATGVAGLDAGVDHVTAAAIHGLARIAGALLELDPHEVMPASHFQRACEGIGQILDRYVERGDWSLQGQMSVLPILGPLSAPSLPTLAVAAAKRATRAEGFAPHEFGFGAESLVTGATALVAADSALVRPDAVECLYSAVIGVLAVCVEDAESADLIDRWMARLTQVVLADEQPGVHKLFRAPEILASVLLIGVYALPIAAPEVGEMLRSRLRATFVSVAGVTPDFERRRLVRAVLPSALAIAVADESALLEVLVGNLGVDLEEPLGTRFGTQFRPHDPMMGTPRPRYTGDHQTDEAVARLQAAIDATAPARATSTPPATKPRKSANIARATHPAPRRKSARPRGRQQDG